MKTVLAVLCVTVAVCQAGLLGGFRPVNTGSKEATEVVSYLEKEMNARSNSLLASKVSNTISIERQIVNGVNYKVTFDFAQTGCRKTADLSLCSPTKTASRCTATVYKSIVPDVKLSLQNFNCGSRGRRMAGGISAPKANKDAYKDVMLKAIQTQNSNLQNYEIVEVRTQVVAGEMIYMKIRGTDNGKNQLCDVKVWRQTWTNMFSVEKFDCQEEKQKRACAGCIQKDDDPDSNDNRDRLFEAVEAANMVWDKDATKILSVSKQVVAGIRYRMKVQTTQNGKAVKCDIDFVSQPWMNPPTTVLKNTCS